MYMCQKNEQTKTCPNCGEIFHRKQKTSVKNWSTQKYCSTQCYNIGRVKRPKKICPICNNEFTKKKHYHQQALIGKFIVLLNVEQ